MCLRERRQRDAGHHQRDGACDDRRVNLAPARRTSIARFHQILTKSTNRDRDNSKIGRDGLALRSAACARVDRESTIGPTAPGRIASGK